MSFQPEIKDDELYRLIVQLVKEKKPKHILEIGSADGQGSTQAFIEGLDALPDDHNCALYCIEAHPERFAELQSAVKYLPFVKCYNASTVPVGEYITDLDIGDFLKDRHYSFNIVRYGENTVRGWRREEISMIVGAGVMQDGMKWAKKQIKGKDFDMVLADGSAFTGYAEYKRYKGAKILILDDTLDIKNFHVTVDLLASGEYQPIYENRKYRNGYAVFERIGA